MPPTTKASSTRRSNLTKKRSSRRTNCCSASPELRPASRSPAVSASTHEVIDARTRKSRHFRPGSRDLSAKSSRPKPRLADRPSHRPRRRTRGRRNEIRRLEVEAVKKEKARQKEFEAELAKTVDDFDRQSKAFMKTLEDKALKNKLDKERLARKAELNRAVLPRLEPAVPRASAGGVAAPLLTKEGWQPVG